MSAPESPLRLVVLGDSLAFFDETGPCLPSAPALYPNVAARILEEELAKPVTVATIAGLGWTSRTIWRAVTKEPHVQFQVLMGADAVIVAVGSFDHAPCGIPPSIEALVPFIRPAELRRRVRKALRSLHPVVIRLTRGRWCRTPAPEFERLFDAVLLHVRSLARGAAGVVMGPTDHRSAYYGYTHPHRAARERLQFAVAARHSFPTVPCWPLVEPHIERFNRDGMHWCGEAHAAVGAALAAALVPQLRGEQPRPPAPGFDTLKV